MYRDRGICGMLPINRIKTTYRFQCDHIIGTHCKMKIKSNLAIWLEKYFIYTPTTKHKTFI